MSRFEKKKSRDDVVFDRSQLKVKLRKCDAMMIEKKKFNVKSFLTC